MSQPRVLVEVGIDAQRGRLPAEAESTEGEEKRKVWDVGLPARGMMEEERLRDQEGGWRCGHLCVPMSVCICVCARVGTHNQSGQSLVLRMAYWASQLPTFSSSSACPGPCMAPGGERRGRSWGADHLCTGK